MTQNTPPLRPGDEIGRYRILGEIGRGAMAVVYLAEESDRRRKVAMKVLLSQYENDPAYVTRFINEARAAASLSHANIVEALDIGFENGMHYFCMEYVEGESLQELIEAKGAVPLEQLLDIAEKIAGALEYGWSRHGLTHGDIKPENIMLTRDGDIRLADFGLADMKGYERNEKVIILTPHYAAPELIKGLAARGDCRSDIYAFGATLYHAVSGTTLFNSSSAQDILDKQVHENPEPLSMRSPGTPAPLSRLIGRMLSKNPDERPKDWTAVLSELGSIREMHNRSQQGKSAVKVPFSVAKGQINPEGIKVRNLVRNFIWFSTILLFLSAGGIVYFAYHRAHNKNKAETISNVTVQVQTENKKHLNAPVELRPAKEPEQKPSVQVAPEINVQEKNKNIQNNKKKQVQPKEVTSKKNTQTEQKAQTTGKKKPAKPSVKKEDKTPVKKTKEQIVKQKKQDRPTAKPQSYTAIPDTFTVKLSEEYAALEKQYSDKSPGPVKNTVDKVRELQKACRAENLTAIAQAAKRILDDRTLRLGAKDRAEIESIRESVLMRQPQSMCRDLEDKAEQLLKEKEYSKALSLALVAKGRYGSKRKDIINRALEHLPAKNSKDILQIPFSRSLPFWEYKSLYSSREYKSRYGNAHALSLLSPAALLYMGDWSAGTDIKILKAERMKARERDALPDTDNAALASFGFASTLLCEFIWDNSIDWSWINAAYAVDKRDNSCDAGTIAMTVSAAIMIHRHTADKAEIVKWSKNIKLSGDNSSKKLLAYLLFTYYSESGNKSKLKELTSVLKTAPGYFGFEKTPAIAGSNFDFKTVEEKDNSLKWALFRAWIAHSANSRGLDGKNDPVVRTILQTEATEWSVQGGEAIYAWLLNRVAFMLQGNDLAGAAGLTEDILNTNLVCLIPYYNHLYALHAGLLLRDGKSGGMQTMLNCMKTSTVVSTGTLDMMESLDNIRNRGQVFQKLTNGKNTFVWFHWLMNCNRLHQNMQLLNPDAVSGKCLKHPHEERLLNALPKLH